MFSLVVLMEKKLHLNFAAALMSDKKMCLKMGTDNLKRFFFSRKWFVSECSLAINKGIE